jgi:hypothetical protein
MYGLMAMTWPTSQEFWPNRLSAVGSSLPLPSPFSYQVSVDLAPK